MDFELLSERVYYQKGTRVAAHTLFWVLQFFVSWYNISISFNPYSRFNNQTIILILLSGTINIILIYYPLVYYIIPRLIEKRKYLWSVCFILMLLILYTLINALSETFILKACESCMKLLKDSGSSYYQFLQTSLVNKLFQKLATLGILLSLIFSLSIPLCIKFILQVFREQIVSAKIARQNVELEYNFLKSQVNPHFLFNSLNNIYGLILKDENSKAAETVARLCEFMRYTLYYATQDKMPLNKEVQLIRDYIQLESIRLNHTKVNLELNIDNDDYYFPSLLLMPVVENAFKYNADIDKSIIYIHLSIQHNELHFRIENTVDKTLLSQLTGGIGLQNFRKRLDLYYRGKYQYDVLTTGSKYAVILNINLWT